MAGVKQQHGKGEGYSRLHRFYNQAQGKEKAGRKRSSISANNRKWKEGAARHKEGQRRTDCKERRGARCADWSYGRVSWKEHPCFMLHTGQKRQNMGSLSSLGAISGELLSVPGVGHWGGGSSSFPWVPCELSASGADNEFAMEVSLGTGP